MSGVSEDELPAGEDLAPPPEPVLVLIAGGRWLALPLAVVREVVPGKPLTRLPGAPSPVGGLFNLRGQVLTVVDLAASLRLPPSAAAPSYRVVVLDHRGKQVGLAVGEVVRILHVAPEELEPPAEGEAPAFLRAIGTLDGREFGLLDPDALLGPILA